jgi:hypothetical protein
MSEVELQVQKRLTLNWLIQGAAQHAGMTFHYLVKDELNAIHPKLVHLFNIFDFPSSILVPMVAVPGAAPGAAGL